MVKILSSVIAVSAVLMSLTSATVINDAIKVN